MRRAATDLVPAVSSPYPHRILTVYTPIYLCLRHEVRQIAPHILAERPQASGNGSLLLATRRAFRPAERQTVARHCALATPLE